MHDPHQPPGSFFGTPFGTPVVDPSNGFPGFPKPPMPPLPEVSARLIPEHVAPPPVIISTTSGKTKRNRRRYAPKRAELSTWVVGSCLLAFGVVLAPANPAFGIMVFGGVSIATGLYSMASGRSSWARLSGRRMSLLPLAIGAALIWTATILPPSVMVAPSVLSKPPTPTVEQSAALVAGFAHVDARFPTVLSPEDTVARSNKICVNDFSSQTPEQEVKTIGESVSFPTPPKTLTPDQSRQLLELVRNTYCGQPGLREKAAGSKVMWSLPGMEPVVRWSYQIIDKVARR